MLRFFIRQFLSVFRFAYLFIRAYFIHFAFDFLLKRYFPDIMNEIELNEVDIRDLERLENESNELNKGDEGDEDDEDYENDENDEDENILSIADMMEKNRKTVNVLYPEKGNQKAFVVKVTQEEYERRKKKNPLLTLY